MQRTLTALVWLASIATLAVAGLVASEFIFMAISPDPSDLVTFGAEPWSNALMAGAALTGLFLMTGSSLYLWHTRRFKLVGLALTACEIGGVAWVCAKVYREYF